MRQAGPEDYADVVEMHYPSWRESYRGILTPELLDLFDRRTWVTQDYPQRLMRPGWQMWLAESDGQLLGMCIFGPEQDSPDLLEIDSLYVALGSHRQGVGRLLLDHAVASHTAGDIITWCAERNFRARRFYEKVGFERDGRVYNWTLVPGVLDAPQIGYRLRR